MPTLDANQIARIFRYSISEIWKGNIAELLYQANLFVHKVDLSGATQKELNLSKQRANWSSNSGGPQLEHILNTLKITQDDAIVDIGCGKGGALISLSKYRFKKLAGIELSPELIKIAQSNFIKLGITDIALHCCDAGSFQNLDKFNYIYMYNPFPCHVMKEVMVNVSNSITRVPRSMTILYKNPVCHEQIMKTSLFRHTATFRLGIHDLFIYKNYIIQ